MKQARVYKMQVEWNSDPEGELKVARMLTNMTKIYGIQNRLLYKKYKQKYPRKCRNSEQARLKYLAEMKERGTVRVCYIGG